MDRLATEGIISCCPKVTLFADDTSFILISYDESELRHKANEVFNIINKWFHSYSLILNYNKTYFLQFQTKAKMEIIHKCHTLIKLLQL